MVSFSETLFVRSKRQITIFTLPIVHLVQATHNFALELFSISPGYYSHPGQEKLKTMLAQNVCGCNMGKVEMVNANGLAQRLASLLN